MIEFKTAVNLPDGITYEDIRVMYYTGRFERDSGSQDKRAGRYRRGMMTRIGNLEQSEWIRCAEELIRRNGEQQRFEKLKQWYRKTTPWLRNKDELHQYTLVCFAARIFDNPQWVDYAAFREWEANDVN